MNRITRIETPTGPVIVARTVAEQLLKQGVITGSFDGELRAADAAMMKAAMIGAAGNCDFCSAPGAVHAFDVPDFPMPDMPVMSTGGWGACDTCADLVRAEKKKELLERSVGNMSFAKFTRPHIEALHKRFWNAKAVDEVALNCAEQLRRFIDADLLPPTVEGIDFIKQSPRENRVRVIQEEAGLTDVEVDEIIAGTPSTRLKSKLLHWYHKTGGTPQASKLLRLKTADHRPLADTMTPHWQQALDRKFEALRLLTTMITRTDHSEFFEEGIDLSDPAAVREITRKAEERRKLREMGFAADASFLKDAAVYSFNAETIAAIREASATIPSDAALSSIETPNTGAGWFWFAEPLALTASPLLSDRIHALLWSWTNMRPERQLHVDDAMLDRLAPADRERLTAVVTRRSDGGNRYMLTERDIAWLGPALRKAGMTREELEEQTTISAPKPAIVFSAYVIDEKGRWLKAGAVSPSTRFFWDFEDSLDEMLAGNTAAWELEYGEGKPLSKEPYVMARSETLKTVETLARFFAMACVWFRQTVATTKPQLTKEQGHVERHLRKRIMHEHKLAVPPAVHVVALRKSARVEASEAPAERAESAKAYSCRWIVKGHPRHQVCGPGRKDRKLIWIETHVAGPDDKPLRTRETVYAVIR